jgi:acetylornithine deacetylase/succinyl-diaminopimelate desuccinylase-like protein
MSSPAADPRLAAILDTIDRDATIRLAQELVRIPSISGSEGLAISEFMADWLRMAGIDAGVQRVGEGRANVYGRIDAGQPGRRLLLNGHLDTKPGDSMTIDPFGGEIVGKRLYGRGSCDMKGPVAAEMIAMKALAQSGVRLSGTLIFGSEVGEDGGGWKFDDLIDGPGACDVGICGEPTNMQLHVGCRGAFPVVIRTIGRATHTGTAYTGVNAILKMTKVIQELYDLACFHHVDPIWGRAPINAMIINGGGKVSASVPDECTVRFDIRLNPSTPPEEVGAAIDAALAKLVHEDPELKLDVIKGKEFDKGVFSGEPAAAIAPDDPLVATVQEAVETATGARPALAGFPGGCSTMIMHRRGIPSVIFGPGNLEQAHSVDEWVDVDQLYRAARAYAAIAYRILGAS